MSKPYSLVVRYVGYGLTCHGCGKLRETTRFTLVHNRTDKALQEFRLCDACQDKGFRIDLTPDIPGSEPKNSAGKARQVRISQQLERELAHDVGGKTQPGSGNQDMKNDVRVVGKWRLEHKYTDSLSGYRLLVEDLAGVVRHANLAGELPALIVAFRRLSRKFAIFPYEMFIEFVEMLRAQDKSAGKHKGSKAVRPRPPSGGESPKPTRGIFGGFEP